MNKYFIQLFLRENTVILPGFGALTAPNGNVEDIMFMPYLKTDDGKLADFIVETEGVDRQDAQNTIAKFIREMETNLSKGESFDIFQFGSFFKNETGEIEFKSWLKKEEDQEAAAAEEETTEETKEETVEEAKGKIAEEVEYNVEPMTFDTDAIEEVEEKAVITEEINEPAEIVVPKIEKKEIITPVAATKEFIPEVVQQKASAEAPEEKKKNKAPVWIFSILLVSLISFAVFWFWDRGGKKDLDQKVASTETKENLKGTPEDTIQEKEIEAEVKPTPNEPIEEPQVKVETPATDVEILPEDAKGFFLIGGVYSSMTVATDKVKTAKAEGLNAKLLPQGKGKMYISLADFTDRDEANKMLQTLREKGKKVWVLKK